MTRYLLPITRLVMGKTRRCADFGGVDGKNLSSVIFPISAACPGGLPNIPEPLPSAPEGLRPLGTSHNETPNFIW